MNTPLKQRIDEKLDRFSERRVAEVLDFVEFLENRDRAAAPAARDADHSGVSLAGTSGLVKRANKPLRHRRSALRLLWR